jgi:WD40 repeat protein
MTLKPFIIHPINKQGINTLAHSESLNIIVTGSEDGIVRIFSQFSMKMPQMELQGHRAAIVGLALLPIPFSESEILLSYSEDVVFVFSNKI